jgi:hypothetical protein
MLSYKTTAPRYEECSRLHSGTLLYSHRPLISLTLSQLSKLIILVPLTFFATTAHICMTMMRFDHDKFYRRLSNCQPHHTIQILVVRMMVLTLTTMHNRALSTRVPNALHFLCPAKVSAHICLPLMHITLDQ